MLNVRRQTPERYMMLVKRRSKRRLLALSCQIGRPFEWLLLGVKHFHYRSLAIHSRQEILALADQGRG
jgi:hypothetical protein